MPQLFSRVDDNHWLTPTIADILEQGSGMPLSEADIREQLTLLQTKLADLDTPVKIIDVLPTPSYTLFIAKPESVGRLGNRRTVTPNEIRKSIGQLAEENRQWKLGFMPVAPENPDSIGILLRTENHIPLNLRRLMLRNAFRDNASTLAMALGNTLLQQLILYDLATLDGLLIIGTEGAKFHVLQNTLFLLTLLNTPSEIRIAVAGESGGALKSILNVPHLLGKMLTEPEDGVKLIDGFIKEAERRRAGFSEANVTTLDAYNNYLRGNQKPSLPRIILVIDSVSDERWMQTKDRWVAPVQSLLEDGAKIGIHVLMSAAQLDNTHVPKALQARFPIKILSRNAAGKYPEKIENFHGSLMRFIDAFVLIGEEATPIEVSAVSAEEIERATAYWQNAIQTRKGETPQTPVSAKTGVTQLLKIPTDARSQAIINQLPSVIPTTTLHQARALTAYLGWISMGPLQDVLGLNAQEAQEVISVLKASGIVEDSDSPTLRFVRLADFG
jgi:hypothetical protein